jgi:hypothetical protein
VYNTTDGSGLTPGYYYNSGTPASPVWKALISAEGLTNFSESNYLYNTKYGVKLLARNDAQTDVNFVLSPKGSGAIIAQQPDGTTTGGDNRGISAVDLQLSRGLSSQVASGNFSVIAGGYWNEASKNHAAIGGGSGNTAFGSYSCIPGGKSNTANGFASVAFGSNNEANGMISTALGNYNSADGDYSFAAGLHNFANDYVEIVLGQYATVSYGSTGSWIATDRLFTIGNGTGAASNLRSNAFSILKNANTTIGGSLTVNGNGTSYSFPTGRGTNGQILSTDGSGGTSWTSPNAGTVTNVSGTSPISVATGTSTPVISIAAATTSTAGSMSAADKTKLDGIPTLSIGQSYQGGVIFWLDATGQHGLIVATADQSSEMQWNNGTYRYTGTTGDGLYAGAMNTSMIVATQMADNQTGNFAAKVCADYSVTVSGVTYGDWYLPSKYELNLLYFQKVAVGVFASAYYWSSTEYDNTYAWRQYFGNGEQEANGKHSTFYVRAVRAF